MNKRQLGCEACYYYLMGCLNEEKCGGRNAENTKFIPYDYNHRPKTENTGYLFCYRAPNDRILTEMIFANNQQQAIDIFRKTNGTAEILAITKKE